ncbi:putative coA binding domain containing protein [Lyophyllum shimeji]|uniref:CoA binding domain containing protein n=1 Tax=Lyophyllum shimeji TaxID=47721 RepID=A0A9P3PLT1_LYOSH|nr:putative coA binding domain containing protein [Lyophyllum shimeji]
MLIRYLKVSSRALSSATSSNNYRNLKMSYDFGRMNEHQEMVGKQFITTPSFAVVGASKDQTKVGNRILRWYQTRNFDVTPVHFKEPELEGLKCIKDILELPSPKTTALSIITPPKITLGVLKTAQELDIPSLWIQPGAEDEAVLEYIKQNDLTDRVIHGGPCILVLGDGLRSKL